jgi:hypothetical protein
MLPRSPIVLLAAIAGGLGLAGHAHAAIGFDHRAEAGTGARTFFEAGGLRLRAACGGGQGAGDVLGFQARSRVDDAAIHVAVQNQATPGNAVAYVEDDDFDSGAAGKLPIEVVPVDVTENSTGQIVYVRPSGTVVVIDFMTEEDGVPGPRECLAAGTARVLPAGSPERILLVGAEGTGSQEVFAGGGLSVTAECGTLIGPHLILRAQSSAPSAALHIASQSDLNGDGTGDAGYESFDDFQPGPGGQLTFGLSGQGLSDEDSTGQILYTDGTKVVTIDWYAEDDGTALGSDCVFAGLGRVVKASSADRALFVKDVEAQETFLRRGGLRMSGDCDASVPELSFAARTKRGVATVHFNSQMDLGNGGLDDHAYSEDDALHASPPESVAVSGHLNAEEDALGQLLYARGRSVVSLDWMADENDALGVDCLFAGVAEAGTSG